MKKFAALALAISVATVACSGQHGASVVPQGGAAAQSSSMGTKSARAQAITAPAGWAATATGVMSLVNATDLGAVPATQSVTVVLGLQLQNAAQLQSLVASGQTISQSSFDSTCRKFRRFLDEPPS